MPMMASTGVETGGKVNKKAKIKKKAGNDGGKKKSQKEKKAKRVVLTTEEDLFMDLSVPLYPLGHYVSERTQLVDQLFKSLSTDKQWENLLPSILKDIPLNDLKGLCVQQLEVMSKKRIRKILAGEEMESSSGTEDSDDDQANHKSIPQQLQEESSTASHDNVIDKVGNQLENVEDMLELFADNSADELLSEKEDKTNVKQEASEQTLENNNSKMEEDENFEEEMELELPGFNIQAMQLSQPSITIAKTCMEILELELRARAIKALLKSQSNVDEHQVNTKE